MSIALIIIKKISASFSFSSKVSRTTDTLLHQNLNSNNFITIAIHLRHVDRTDQGLLRNGEEECLSALVNHERHRIYNNKTITNNNNNNHSDCMLFLATDRVKTYDLMKSVAVKLHCDLIVAAKNNNNNNNNNNGEHGPWADGISVLVDIDLLSRADHFIGVVVVLIIC